MSLKTELEGFCRHPQGYFYIQDVNGNYLSPARFLVSLSQEVMNSRYGFRKSGTQREYWIYQQGFLGAKGVAAHVGIIPERNRGQIPIKLIGI